MSTLIKHQINPDRYLKFDQFLIEYPKLSGFTKWVYAYIASRPPEWEIYAEEITKHCTEGIGRVKKALAELQAIGLLAIQLKQNEKTNRIEGRKWELFETSVCDALNSFRQALGSRKPQTPSEAPASDEKQGLLRSSPPRSSVLTRSISPASDVTPDQKPEPPTQPAQREIEKQVEAKKKPVDEAAPLPRNRLTERLNAFVNQVANKPLSPEQEAALKHRAEQEARQAALDAEAEAKRQALIDRHYGKYKAVPVHDLIDTLAREFVPQSDAKKDRRYLERLRSWYTGMGKGRVCNVVDAFRLAAKEKAYSVKYVITVLERNFQVQVPEL